MAKLDGKAEPVMIPPVAADYLGVLIGQRVVAGNFPLAHRKMRFEKFRPLCSRQQFMRWNGAAPDSGGGVQSSKINYQQPFQGADTALLGIPGGIANIGNIGVRVLHKHPGHAGFSGIHFRRSATVSSSRSRG